MANELQREKIAFLATDGVEQVELVAPWNAVKAAGKARCRGNGKAWKLSIHSDGNVYIGPDGGLWKLIGA